MAKEMFCMGCMQPISEFSDNCYHCGYPAAGQNPAGYLPVRTQLCGRYVVGRALEKRNDAIVYIGYDKTARNTVLIREYFPGGIAERLSKQVIPVAGKEDAFQACFEAFRKQARVIARMRELPAMIPVYDIFEENGTVYTASDRVEGVPLRRHLQSLGGHMEWEKARPLFIPLINSLISIHAAGLYHLGISPDSIIYDSDNRLRLDGWQLADVRNEGGMLKTKRPVGYAAPEQYRAGGVESSQAADVYALAATMLYVLTGEEPPSAVDRVNKTAALMVPSDVAEKWPAHIAPTLCDALALDVSKRIPTAELLRDRLTIAPVVEALKVEVPEAAPPVVPVPAPAAPPKVVYKTNRLHMTLVIVLSIVCALLLVGVALIFLLGKPFSSSEEATPVVEETDVTDVTDVSTTTTQPTQTKPTFVDPVATNDLTALSLEDIGGSDIIQIVGMEFSDEPFGEVVSQSPAPGETVERGTVIKVYISAGPKSAPLADLSGMDIAFAKEYLQLRGYLVNEVPLALSDAAPGTVDRTEPAGGTTVEVGSVIDLLVNPAETE